jgi:hypothetical protein
MKEEFMNQRERFLKQYPFTPDEAFQGKPCPDCEGLGDHAESNCCGGSIIEGICFTCKQPTEPTKCLTCKGSGIVDYTEDDIQNNKENEIIGNSEMMKDPV